MNHHFAALQDLVRGAGIDPTRTAGQWRSFAVRCAKLTLDRYPCTEPLLEQLLDGAQHMVEDVEAPPNPTLIRKGKRLVKETAEERTRLLGLVKEGDGSVEADRAAWTLTQLAQVCLATLDSDAEKAARDVIEILDSHQGFNDRNRAYDEVVSFCAGLVDCESARPVDAQSRQRISPLVLNQLARMSDRSLRLFACRCAERILNVIQDPHPVLAAAVKTGLRLAEGEAARKEVAEVRCQAKPVVAAAQEAKAKSDREFDRGLLPGLDHFVLGFNSRAAQVALLCINASAWEAARGALVTTPGCLVIVGQIEVYRAVNRVALETLGLPFINTRGSDQLRTA